MPKGRKGRNRKSAGERKPSERSEAEPGFIPDTFISYYKTQLVPELLTEQEFDEMISILKTSLPHVFRLSPVAKGFDKLKADLEVYLDAITKEKIDVKKINFFGDSFGPIYQLSVDKPTLRKNPALQPFRDWLHTHEDAGDFSRQELVSMIPPYFLDVKPDHIVLDMCAAPGSKTTQVIEMMQAQSSPNCPSGVVIANEVKSERCRTLIGRLQRLDTQQTIVTAHAGQQFPHIAEFDRIVCDVPCSGDGTLRKSPDAGPRWNLNEAMALHPVQRSILINALQMLKVGGRVVYSTCSLNPIENEAVINSILNAEPNVRTVDVSSVFPSLNRKPGLKKWTVFNGDKPLNSIEDVPSDVRHKFNESMFPNAGVHPGVANCMRFFPHLNDTGGFFVTVLEKTGDVTVKVPLPPKKNGNWIEPSFIPLDGHKLGDEVFGQLKEQFGLDDTFDRSRVFVRGDDIVHSILYLNENAAKIVKDAAPEILRAFSAGTRAFSWKTLKHPTAVCGVPCFEGIDVAFAHASKRKFEATPADMAVLLAAGNSGAPFEQLSEGLQKAMADALPGGLFVHVPGTSFIYGGMRNRATLSLHVKKEAIKYELTKIQELFPDAVPKGKAD